MYISHDTQPVLLVVVLSMLSRPSVSVHKHIDTKAVQTVLNFGVLRACVGSPRSSVKMSFWQFWSQSYRARYCVVYRVVALEACLSCNAFCTRVVGVQLLSNDCQASSLQTKKFVISYCICLWIDAA